MAATGGRALVTEGDRVAGRVVAAYLRRESTVPIIMLAASRDEAARIAALDAGADDYVAKPVSMPAAARPGPVELTRRELELLAALLRYPGRVHARAQLLELVWAGTRSAPRPYTGM